MLERWYLTSTQGNQVEEITLPIANDDMELLVNMTQMKATHRITNQQFEVRRRPKMDERYNFLVGNLLYSYSINVKT